MIINPRGTHGSGKSYIAHWLISQGDEPIMENGAKIGHYIPRYELGIVGTYKTACGGCDGVKSADEVCRRVVKFNKEYKNVLFEGILVSHTYGRYSKLAEELGINNFVFAFLDTPLDLCIERVKARRVTKGNNKPLNPANIIKDWHNVWEGVREKCLQSGKRVVVLDHTKPMVQVIKLLSTQTPS